MDWWEFFLKTDDFVILKPRFCGIKEMEKACSHASEDVGKPYSFDFNNSDDSLYCSEACAESYARSCGWDRNSNREPSEFRHLCDGKIVSPSDLLPRSDCMGKSSFNVIRMPESKEHKSALECHGRDWTTFTDNEEAIRKLRSGKHKPLSVSWFCEGYPGREQDGSQQSHHPRWKFTACSPGKSTGDNCSLSELWGQRSIPRIGNRGWRIENPSSILKSVSVSPEFRAWGKAHSSRHLANILRRTGIGWRF